MGIEFRKKFLRRQVYNYSKTRLLFYFIINFFVYALATSLLVAGLHGNNNGRPYGFMAFISIGFYIMGLVTIFLGVNPVYYIKLRNAEREGIEEDLIKLSLKYGQKGTAALCSLYKIESKEFETIFKKNLGLNLMQDESMMRIIPELLLLEEDD